MSLLSKMGKFLLAIIKTLQLSLPKIGVGWMFALLTINFNRITITELGIVAAVVTAMLSLHYFLSPFQVISGRIADRYPVFGYRRTPYLLVGAVVASLLFVTLPSLANGMATGAPLAFVAGFGVFLLYGVAIAVIGDSHHALIAEVTEPRSRGGVISVVWIVTIISTIVAAGVMRAIMPEFTPEAMQRLYNLTPMIVIGSTLLGVVFVEKRLTGAALTQSITRAQSAAPAGNPLRAASKILRENKQARGFFAFLFVGILAIFLQDNILEPFGGEVFGMPQDETTMFQQYWGGGVLIGMLLIGIISTVFAISKRTIALIGCIGTALGMGLLAFAALSYQQALLMPSLLFMGFFTGFFNVGALSMMMDMTVAGATGLYMGLWGVAQAFGNGLASFGGGVLHTGLIETGLMSANAAYFTIFSLEAIGMIAAAAILWTLSVERFHNLREDRLTQGDTLQALEAGAV